MGIYLRGFNTRNYTVVHGVSASLCCSFTGPKKQDLERKKTRASALAKNSLHPLREPMHVPCKGTTCARQPFNFLHIKVHALEFTDSLIIRLVQGF